MEIKDWYSLDESAELISRSLFAESEEEDLKINLSREIAKSQHKKTLIKKAQAGEVSLHTSFLVPIPVNEILFHLKHNAGLLKKNLEKYASEIGIKLFVEFVEKGTMNRVQPKSAQQSKAILDKIKSLGLDPLALPAEKKRGNRTIKADIKEDFLCNSKMFTKDTFDNAWKAMKAEGKIKSVK